MVGKNNFKQHLAKEGNKVQRFTLRKLSVGVVSVSVGALLMLSNGAMSVSAEEADVAGEEETELVEKDPVEDEVVNAVEENSTQEEPANNEAVETTSPVSETETVEPVAVEDEVEPEVTVNQVNEEETPADEVEEEQVDETEAEVSQPTLKPVSPTANIISGKADANNSITVTLPDESVLTGNSNRWGNFNISVPDGTTMNIGDTLTVVATDEAGNSSTPLEYVIPDLVEETQFSVEPILPEEFNEGVSGTAVPGAYVTMHYGNGNIAAQADENGNWFIDTAGGYAYSLTPGKEIDFSVAVNGNSYRNVERVTVEEAPVVELPRPTTLRNERVPHGTTIYAEDFVTNSEEFPEGTTFEFYDYETATGTESLELDVSPNPVTRNERLVIRATHPNAEEVIDSFGFTVIIEAPEAPEAPEVYDIATQKSNRVEGITPEGAEEIRVYLPNDTEEYREARILSARPGTNTRSFTLALPEDYTWEAGDEVRVTALDADGNESEATVKTVFDSDELTQLTVNPIAPEAEVISGTVNPDAESVQVGLPNGTRISANVAEDGTWSVQTRGNASSLTPGEGIDVFVRLDGNTHTYENEVFVSGEVDFENSSHVLARLGSYGDRYYRNTITLVDELGRPVTGLTEEDFNIDTYGGIANFEAEGNIYKIDTEYADDLRPNHSLSIDENGVIQINIEEEVDTSALENLIEEAEAISNEDDQYTEESFAALQDAIDDARSALGTVETPEDVTEAVNALQAAIDGLEETPEEPTDPEDDRLAELEERLAELEEAARRLEEENAALEKELAALREELAEANESIAELEDRLAELEARLAELEEADQDDDQGSDQDDDQGSDQDDDQGSDQNDDQGSDQDDDQGSDQDDDQDSDQDDDQGSDRDDDQEQDQKADEDTDVDQNGERLPDTATAAWALGLVGLTSLLSGLGIKKFKK